MTAPAKTDPIRYVTDQKAVKIFFSAAEPSGDIHAAKLISRLKVSIPHIQIEGLGGPNMEGSGCKLLENMVDRSAMLLHVLRKTLVFYQRLRRLRSYFSRERPDLVVVVDSFAWNIHIAKAASSMGIPVVFFIAPQFWAWAPWRIKKLKKIDGKVACILPFEEKWFCDRGVDAVSVGHPLFEDLNRDSESKPRPVEDIFPNVALLPGSRQHEIGHLWPAMLEIARNIKNVFPEARFSTVTTDDFSAERMRAMADPLLGIEIRRAGIDSITANADLTLVASGTATLQVAAQHCPMIVMYYVHPLQWHLLGRWLLNIPHLCLVNILAERELVPEFIPFYKQTHEVSQTALDLLDSKGKRKTIRNDLKNLIDPLMPSQTSQKVTDLIEKMINK